MGDENSLAGATKAHRHSAVSSDGGFLETTVTGMTNLGNGSLITGDASNIQTEISAGSAGDLLEMGATLPQWTTPVSVSSTWKILGQTTLTSPSTSMGVFWSAVDVCDFLQIFATTLNGGGTIRRYLSFSGDGSTYDHGSNYSSQFSSNFASPSTSLSNIGIVGYDGGSEFDTISVACVNATESKLVIRHSLVSTSNSASVSPTNRQVFGKWANITQSVRGVEIWDGTAGGLFATGSGLLVLGTNL